MLRRTTLAFIQECGGCGGPDIVKYYDVWNDRYYAECNNSQEAKKKKKKKKQQDALEETNQCDWSISF